MCVSATDPGTDTIIHNGLEIRGVTPSTGGARNCAGCPDVDTDGWHYVCAPCGVRLHPWCLLGDCGGEDKDEDEDRRPFCASGARGREECVDDDVRARDLPAFCYLLMQVAVLA